MTVSEAIVDLDAFAANVTHLRETVAPAELMVVLKANAYGHGVVEVGLAAVRAGSTRLGTLDIDSALALRSVGIGQAVSIMAWQYPPEQSFEQAIAAGVDLGVSRFSELAGMADGAAAAGRPARLHLKIDTGLYRNGVTAAEWPEFVTAALELEQRGLAEVYGVWTHIAEASDDEDTLALRRFLDAVEVAEKLGARFVMRHLAASSAGLRRADVRLDMVRMGGHCWGIPSFDGVTPAEIGLTPVMTLRSRVTALRTGADGARLAVIPLGYADGIPAGAAGTVDVAIGGTRHRVVEVGADATTVRLNGDAAWGDDVVLFGPGTAGEQTVREWGDLVGTLGDEIVTRITTRVPRRYIGYGTGDADAG